jgi:hypothetical protein
LAFAFEAITTLFRWKLTPRLTVALPRSGQMPSQSAPSIKEMYVKMAYELRHPHLLMPRPAFTELCLRFNSDSPDDNSPIASTA